MLLSAAPFPGDRATPQTTDPTVQLHRIAIENGAAWAPTSNGGRAKLTIDPDLQRAAQRLLSRAAPESGAIIAIDPRTARLLVWAERSVPGTAGSVMTAEDIPAASVIKIVTATALLEDAHVSPDRIVCTDGGVHALAHEHLAPPSKGAAVCGPFREALGRSRNAAFAQLAHRFLSPERLGGAAERLGFGSDVPFDVPIPMGRLVLPEDSELGFAKAAAGFVGSTLTPLGGAYLAFLIAARGRASELQIVEETPEEGAPRNGHVLGRRMAESTARELTRMMEYTVHGGTSLHAFSDASGQSYLRSIRVAGKTGTLKPPRRSATTSWFIGFAPSRNPKLVLSVMLNNGPTWRRKANEVARDVFRAYFAARGVPGVTAPE